MARTKRTPYQRECDRAETADLYLHGTPQDKIADKLGVSQQQISYDLHVIRRRWVASQIRDFDQAKAQELARIDALEREYWDAWNKSRGPHEVSRTQLGRMGEAVAGITREQRDGDPRYLAGVQWCIEQRCKILGLNAPVKQDLTSGGRPFAAIREVVVEMPADDDAPAVED